MKEDNSSNGQHVVILPAPTGNLPANADCQMRWNTPQVQIRVPLCTSAQLIYGCGLGRVLCKAACATAPARASAPAGRQHAPEGDLLWVCRAAPGRCSLRAGKIDCALCAVQVTATAANSRQAAGRSPEEYIQALWEMHLTDLMLPLQDMLPEKQLESLADQFREAIEPLVHALPRDEDGGVVDETRKLWARAVA